ncbi:hypothetical protein AD998_18445 [bacterium 336/3]|nr:hypothetical protein AD998_18445 [bacterium 336/3]
MIPIRHPNLNELAQKHWEAIKNRDITAFSKKDFQNVENWFLNKGYTFENVVKAKPHELDEIASKLQQKQYHVHISKLIDLYKDFAKFSSNWNVKGGDKYNAYELVKELGMQVCPYCNRNYIRNLQEKRTCEFDHFYPKEAYPFLAMSFYNLIPSCKTCNQTLKGSKEISINPYDTDFFEEKFSFKLKIKKASFYHDSKQGFELDFTEVKNKLQENFTVFEIENLYNQHKDIILELIQKQVTYSDDYIDDLFKRYEGTLFKNREDVLRHIGGNYVSEENFHKRPLSKLTHDIAEDLGFI